MLIHISYYVQYFSCARFISMHILVLHCQSHFASTSAELFTIPLLNMSPHLIRKRECSANLRLFFHSIQVDCCIESTMHSRY